jgi:hypothetical protein
MWNFWSLLILIVTLPVWYLPARAAKSHWLNFERHRIAKALQEPIMPASDIPWIWLGVVAWGGLMWGVFSAGVAIAAIARGEWHLLWAIPAMIPHWVCGGLLLGVVMKFWMNRTPQVSS